MQPDVLRRTHIDDFPASQTVDLSSDKFDDLRIILPCKCIPTIPIVVFFLKYVKLRPKIVVDKDYGL